MDQVQLEDLRDLAGAIARSAKFRKLPDDSIYILPRVQNTLLLLKSTLELIGLEDMVDTSSFITTIIIECKKILSRVQNLTHEIMAASGEVSNPFKACLEDCVHMMNDALGNLQDRLNVLLLVTHTGPPSQHAINEAKVVKVELDELAKDLLNAASRIFQPIKQPEDGSEGLTVEEIRSSATDTRRVVCPKADIYEMSKERRTKVKFRCLCYGAPHESQLSYKGLRGKTLLREEINLDGLRRWSIMLWRSNESVIVRLIKVPPCYIHRVQVLADDFGVAYVADQRDSALKTDAESRRFECFQNDWMFPLVGVSTVKSESAGVERTLVTPPKITLSHCSIVPSLVTNLSRNNLVAGRPRPESHFRVTLDSSTEVLVSTETEIRLGRLSVTLAKVVLAKATGEDKDREECDVHFGFGNRDATESFAQYITVAQETLFEKLMRGLYYDESIIYFRDGHLLWNKEAQSQIQLMILSRGRDGLTDARRAILLQHDSSRYICLDLKSRTSTVLEKRPVEDLKHSTVWVYDTNSTGKPCLSKTTWGALARPKITNSNVPAVFINRGHERPAEEWQEEVNDLVRVMKGDQNDPYERVKIAIIDSGLNDKVKSRYAHNKIVFRDFTKSTRNESWHGACCAKIICDIYEEARLYIARIFEDEYVDQEQGPLRMAQAIEWAISPENRVDIINISAGFREHSEELEAAVTRATALGVLVVAAAANWANLGVAYPARHHLTTMCIYSTNTGNQGSMFNPEPLGSTNEFAVLGEGFKHPDPLRGTDDRISGTSMATAAAVGIAATIIDFSRQRDNKSAICRSQYVGRLPKMLSIFGIMSNPARPLHYIAPLSLLPEDRGLNREAGRRRARELLSMAMENSN